MAKKPHPSDVHVTIPPGGSTPIELHLTHAYNDVTLTLSLSEIETIHRYVTLEEAIELRDALSRCITIMKDENPHEHSI